MKNKNSRAHKVQVNRFVSRVFRVLRPLEMPASRASLLPHALPPGSQASQHWPVSLPEALPRAHTTMNSPRCLVHLLAKCLSPFPLYPGLFDCVCGRVRFDPFPRPPRGLAST